MLIEQGLVNDCMGSLEMRPPVVVEPGASIGSTIGVMQKECVGCVLVHDGRTLLGIFTERDVLIRVLNGGASMDDTVQTVMTPKPKTLKSSDNLGSAVHAMHNGGLRHLPVVGEDGVVIGVVSVKRIIQHLVEHFPQAVYNLPPDSAVVATAREGG